MTEDVDYQATVRDKLAGLFELLGARKGLEPPTLELRGHAFEANSLWLVTAYGQ